MKKLYKYYDFIVFLFFMIFAGCLSITFGMERMFDTRNYHIYNPYAFLNNRIDIDILPAGIQTYYNPILDIPYWLAIEYLNNHPFIITFIYGFSYALFLFTIYKIAKLIFKDNSSNLLIATSVFTISGMYFTIRYIGWFSHDLFVGTLILVSLYLIFRGLNQKYQPLLFLVAGIVAGSAVGFKLTAIIFFIPLYITCFIYNKQFIKPIKTLSWLILGGIIGFLITDGIWLYKLYSTFGNPFFPHFNWLFNSPDIASADVYTGDFSKSIPGTQQKIWLAPFYLFRKEWNYWLVYFAFLANLFTIPFFNKEKFEKEFCINTVYINFILIFIFLSYIFWAYLFGVKRYFYPMLGLSAIIGFIVLFKIYSIICNITEQINLKYDLSNEVFKKAYTNILIIIFLIILFPTFTLRPEKKLIRVPIKDKILYVENMNIPDNSRVIVIHGNAFIIPFQNPKARYYGLNAIEFTRSNKSLLTEKKINEIKQDIYNNKDNIYLITNINAKYLTNINKESLNIYNATAIELDRLDIDIKNTECTDIKTNINDKKHIMNWYICKLNLKKK